MTAWHDLPTEEERQAAWAAGESWGLVRDLTAAREIIRRLDPPLALLLDTLHPVPPCPHKGMEKRPGTWKAPASRWKCRGCGIDVIEGARGWMADDPERRLRVAQRLFAARAEREAETAARGETENRA